MISLTGFLLLLFRRSVRGRTSEQKGGPRMMHIADFDLHQRVTRLALLENADQLRHYRFRDEPAVVEAHLRWLQQPTAGSNKGLGPLLFG